MKNRNRKNEAPGGADINKIAAKLEKRRQAVENTASCGLILLAIALVAPFGAGTATWVLPAAKWIYAVGALTYFTARIINVSGPKESPRLRRLRRMESWAGIAFVVASAFWFWHSAQLGEYAGLLALLRDTILFSLVGAVIQIISAFLIASQLKKEGAGDNN